MNKLFLSALLLFFAPLLPAQTPERLKILVKIEHKNGGLRIFRSETGDLIPTAFLDKKVEKELTSLGAGDDALIEGQINYRPVTIGEKTSFRPYFSIESVHPVSLKGLGNIGTAIPESEFEWSPEISSFSPYTIPVSTEVASALTMTSALLLMNSLTTGKADPSGRQDLRQGLIISAGTMATILFIYEQMKQGNKTNE